MNMAKNIIVVNEAAIAHAPTRIVATPSQNAQVVIGIAEAARLAAEGDDALDSQTQRFAEACLLKNK